MNSLSKELHNEIVQTFSNPEFMKDLSINQTFIKKYVENDFFIDKINSIVENKDYSCRAVLSSCQDMLNKLAENNVPEDWLKYIYQFTLGKSFPHAVNTKMLPDLDEPCLLYLQVLRIVSKFQKESEDGTWQSKYPLEFLTFEEERTLEDGEEYRIFLKAFAREYIYEMMKLHQEVTNHNTLDHICGVHYLALFIARQLHEAGLPVDLGRVSGAISGILHSTIQPGTWSLKICLLNHSY